MDYFKGKQNTLYTIVGRGRWGVLGRADLDDGDYRLCIKLAPQGIESFDDAKAKRLAIALCSHFPALKSWNQPNPGNPRLSIVVPADNCTAWLQLARAALNHDYPYLFKCAVPLAEQARQLSRKLASLRRN